MRVRKRKEIVAKGKAAVALQRTVGWTRSAWINEVASALAEAFILFAEGTLAARNGQRRDARALSAEFDRTLFARVVEVHVHPVKDEFDRGAAFEEAVSEMRDGSIRMLRMDAEQELGKVCAVRCSLDDRDLGEFWRRATAAPRILTGEI